MSIVALEKLHLKPQIQRNIVLRRPCEDGPDRQLLANELPGCVFWIDGRSYGKRFSNRAGVGGGGIAYSGACASFDGNNDYMEVAGNPTDLQITDAFLLQLYFKTTAVANGTLFSKYTTTGNQRALRVFFSDPDQYLTVWFSSDGTNIDSGIEYTTEIFDDDAWHHLAITYEPGTEVGLWVDGSKIGSDVITVPSAMHDSTANWVVGAFNAGASGNYDGEAAQFAIYDLAAVPTDIATDIRYAHAQGKLPHERPGSSLLSSELKGYWPITEALYDTSFSSVPDHSGNGHQATMSGGTAVTGEGDIPQLATRGMTQAYRFNGTDDDWDGGNLSDLNFERTDAFSIGLIVCSPNFAANRTLLGKRQASGNFSGWEVGLDTSGNVRFALCNDFSPSNQLAVDSTYALAANECVHAIITYDGSSDTSGVSMYINGQATTPVSLVNDLDATTQTSADFRIGSRSGSVYTHGIIDEVCIFDVELTATEAAELAGGGTPIDPNNHSQSAELLHYYRNGWVTTAGTIEDRSGNNDHLSINGSPDSVLLSASLYNPKRHAIGGHIRQSNGVVLSGGTADSLLELRDPSGSIIANNIFSGGGTILGWIYPLSDGENDAGRLYDSDDGDNIGISLFVSGETGGSMDLSLTRFHATTDGQWTTTTASIPVAAWTFFAVTLTDGAGNQPTFYLGIDGTLSTLTVGSGITETAASQGAADSDASNVKTIGDRPTGDRGFHGNIGQLAAYDNVKAAHEIELLWRDTERFYQGAG